jgi:hypothetical protein
MEEIDGIAVDLGLLPDDLTELAPLIRKFAVADDVRRDQVMEVAGLDEVRALASLSDSQWSALETFLDAHIPEPGTPHQDLALVLSAFGEAAAEARLQLDRG